MRDLLLFAILGIGAGSAYALLALGIVLIQKGTGAVNFAHGAIAGVAAIYFAVSTDKGMSIPTAVVTALLGAGVGGVLFYLVVMRPLRDAPLLARIVSTLGLMVILGGLATKIWGSPSVVAPGIFPNDSIEVFGVAFGVDRLWLLGTTVVLATALWVVYRFTTFGIATRAAAESERGAMLLGYSPDLIGAVNWALGSMLAALAGILIAPITTLDIATLTLLVVPALAAALLGRFNSFGITAGVAIAIGMGQSLLTRYWQQAGVNDALPFVIVIVAMVLAGQLIPARGSAETRRLPLAPAGRPSGTGWGVLAAAVIVGLIALNGSYQAAIATSLIFTILALSVVVVTGFIGEISLAQMAFAGVGGFAVSKFAVDLGIPFPLPILLGMLVAVPIGVVLGLPALRVRGINLAIVTLGAAVAISGVVFQNADWTGGGRGSEVPSPEILGLSLDAVAHPVRFGLFALLVVGVAIWLVMNLRRSASGRRMLAVRSNERAAALAGIDVSQTKLQSFALSAAIASLGGGMLAYQLGAVAFDRFAPMASITLVAIVYIGGIATVKGAVFAGVITNGGVLYVLLSGMGGIDSWWIVISGAGLLITAVLQPDGATVALEQQIRALRDRVARKNVRGPGLTGPRKTDGGETNVVI
jgi:ABC-type branched-subunit amino acid transport system permease subunit